MAVKDGDIKFNTDSVISPHYKQLESSLYEWAQKCDFISNLELFKSRKYASCAARLFPFVKNFETLSLTSKLLTWMFYWYDYIDSCKSEKINIICCELIEALKRKEYVQAKENSSVQQAMFVSLIDLWMQAIKLTPPSWQQRFINSLKVQLTEDKEIDCEYIGFCFHENSDLKFSREMRFGINYCLILMEFAYNVFLSEEALNTEVMNLVVANFSSSIVGIHDLFHYQKEKRDGGLNNYISIYINKYSYSEKESFAEVIKMVNDGIYRHAMIMENIGSHTNDENIRKFVKLLSFYFRGLFDFYNESTRYVY
ncbi:Terpene synthase metal-binding domain-containing protein-like protein [Leptotrombidium deliense]|uniref:Terpene synthase metal-binding domain-containing protein-like protein n=1 Tax=Leptotrombidium deliense TaxID=299467 RepID=A0A443SNJ3_9ACAR|nr:Terpene synthase metal-binding domain-containing protein-like protein [Leptotrombidium deliense]